MPKMRLSRIVTKTGDDGKTTLADGSRVSKQDIRIEVMGTIDELNSCIGMVIAFHQQEDNITTVLQSIQHQLFDLGAELCDPNTHKITKDYADGCEKILKAFNAKLPPLKEFILPGGNPAAATCHLARTICRRAERALVALSQNRDVNPESIKFINRLSDLLFVLARSLADREIQWLPQK